MKDIRKVFEGQAPIFECYNLPTTIWELQFLAVEPRVSCLSKNSCVL